jgi:hypothetical protein
MTQNTSHAVMAQRGEPRHSVDDFPRRGSRAPSASISWAVDLTSGAWRCGSRPAVGATWRARWWLDRPLSGAGTSVTHVKRGPPCRGRLAAPSRPESSSEDARGDRILSHLELIPPPAQ